MNKYSLLSLAVFSVLAGCGGDNAPAEAPKTPITGVFLDNTVENLDYALKDVPKEKLSLGIGLYGYHWFAGDPGLNKPEQKPNPAAESISFANAEFLRATYNGKLQWDEDDHTPWFYVTRDQTREWVFYTDKHAFMDRYELAKQRGLQGVCSWVLGQEDPAIWDAIPAKR